MAHCVISRIVDTGDDHYARLLTALGEAVTVCMVHAHYEPCPAGGQPASPVPLHTDLRHGRVPAVAEWVTRTARQRPLVIHQGNLGSAAPAHETGGPPCWCRPEIIPAVDGP